MREIIHEGNKFVSIDTWRKQCKCSSPSSGPRWILGEGYVDKEKDEYKIAIRWVRLACDSCGMPWVEEKQFREVNYGEN